MMEVAPTNGVVNRVNSKEKTGKKNGNPFSVEFILSTTDSKKDATNICDSPVDSPVTIPQYSSSYEYSNFKEDVHGIVQSHTVSNSLPVPSREGEAIGKFLLHTSVSHLLQWLTGFLDFRDRSNYDALIISLLHHILAFSLVKVENVSSFRCRGGGGGDKDRTTAVHTNEI